MNFSCHINSQFLFDSSRFSVAWYPVYRIPDGNFHAAFLTYHSFGSLVQQSGSENMVNGLKHLVSPVVGLQTYNDRVLGFIVSSKRILELNDYSRINYLVLVCPCSG